MFAAINRKYKVLFTIKNVVADIFCRLFLLNFPNKWSMVVASRFAALKYPVKAPNGKKFKLLANTDLLMYRAKTFENKEPETNKWISTIPSDAVFYDVGANVGVFSIMASAFCRKVFAFEPVAVNYSILNQNLMINSLDNVVSAYCLAISDVSSFDTMRLSSGAIGSAHHSFGVDLNACHQEFSPVFKQAAFAISLDDLIYKFNFDCPSYLKIDVDGNEHLVIKGAEKLLLDKRLTSVLIELNKNLKIDIALIDKIKGNGFELTEVGEEASLNGMQIGNLIFFRK